MYKNKLVSHYGLIERDTDTRFSTSVFLLILTILGPRFTIYDNFKFTFKLSKLFKFEVINGSMLSRESDSAGVCSPGESDSAGVCSSRGSNKNFQTYSLGVYLSLNSPGACFLGIWLPGRSILPGSRLPGGAIPGSMLLPGTPSQREYAPPGILTQREFASPGSWWLTLKAASFLEGQLSRKS